MVFIIYRRGIVVAVVQERGAELCVRERDRQHGADHAESGQEDGGRAERRRRAQAQGQDPHGHHPEPQRRLPQEVGLSCVAHSLLKSASMIMIITSSMCVLQTAADWFEHVWRSRAGAGTEGQAAPHRGTYAPRRRATQQLLTSRLIVTSPAAARCRYY